MKRTLGTLAAALLCLLVLAAPGVAATGKPASPGKGNPYPPGQSGKCDPTQEAQYGGCPPGSPGRGVRATSTSPLAGEELSVSGGGYRPNSPIRALLGGEAVPGGSFVSDAA